MITIKQLPEFDITEHLDSEEAVAAYLAAVIEENDQSELAHALGVVARARNDAGGQLTVTVFGE